MAHKQVGAFSAAIEDYDEAIRLSPDAADIYNIRAFLRQDMGDHDSSIDDFTEAIRLDPNQPQYHRNRGLAYAQKEEDETTLPNAWLATLWLGPVVAAIVMLRAPRPPPSHTEPISP